MPPQPSTTFVITPEVQVALGQLMVALGASQAGLVPSAHVPVGYTHSREQFSHGAQGSNDRFQWMSI